MSDLLGILGSRYPIIQGPRGTEKLDRTCYLESGSILTTSLSMMISGSPVRIVPFIFCANETANLHTIRYIWTLP
jgi:hypothetical protein